MLITVEGYPPQSAGMLKGKIETLSALPVHGFYTAIILADDGLRSTAGHEIPCPDELSAIGEIIVQEKTVLQRLF